MTGRSPRGSPPIHGPLFGPIVYLDDGSWVNFQRHGVCDLCCHHHSTILIVIRPPDDVSVSSIRLAIYIPLKAPSRYNRCHSRCSCENPSTTRDIFYVLIAEHPDIVCLETIGPMGRGFPTGFLVVVAWLDGLRSYTLRRPREVTALEKNSSEVLVCSHFSGEITQPEKSP